jgi:hypothetical protein
MTHIVIICEGQTEREFCRDTLAPYLMRFGIILHYPLVKRSGGGIVHWDQLKRQIELHLQGEPNVRIVTTFIDLYGIRAKHRFPGFEESGRLSSPQRVQQMCDAMLEAIDERLRYRFLPYLQLHEFEALVFADVNVVYELFQEGELIQPERLDEIAAAFPNPEDINDHPNTAPSARLQSIIPGYSKVLYGTLLTEGIGMTRLLERCPSFAGWVAELINVGEQEGEEE